jgi:hypothetical protein
VGQPDVEWSLCDPDDADLLGQFNAELSEDEGAQPVGR